MKPFVDHKPPCHRRQSGISLIIVLIMLVVIGLTSASAIRNATSGERATNNIRMQNLAQQYAEAALRFCESQLALASAARVVTLWDDKIEAAIPFGSTPLWEQKVTWNGASGTGGASKSRTVLTEDQIKSGNGSITPANRPQCVVERQTLADGGIAWVLTARGFSPDYSAMPTNDATRPGDTLSGSVVWLQSIVYK